MKPREVLERIKELGGFVVRQESSHLVVRAGACQSVMRTPGTGHGRDLRKGMLRSIERDLEPALGRRWLLS